MKGVANGSPISIYNSTKKELIGIFKVPVLAARYLYNDRKYYTNIYSAALYKSRLHNTFFSFPVAVRYATKEQIDTLAGMDYIILNEYPEPKDNEMRGFTSTKYSLHTQHCENRSYKSKPV